MQVEASLSEAPAENRYQFERRVISVPKARVTTPGARLPSHHLTEGSLGKGSERLKTIPWMGITDALGIGFGLGRRALPAPLLSYPGGESKDPEYTKKPR